MILKLSYAWKDESGQGIPVQEIQDYTHLIYPDLEAAINDLINRGYVTYIQGPFPELFAKPIMGQSTQMQYNITQKGIDLIEDPEQQDEDWKKKFDELDEPPGDGADPAGIRM